MKVVVPDTSWLILSKIEIAGAMCLNQSSPARPFLQCILHEGLDLRTE